MEWTERQILDTLRMIEASEYDEVKIEAGDFKLHVRRSGAPSTLGTASVAGPAATAPAAPVPLPATAPSPVSAIPTPPTETVVVAEDAPPGIVVVRAPMIGTFYRAPSPASPPFTDTGASVKSDDTVCLIEVMKLFNTIKAGTAGKVVRILAHNAATVRKDDPLLWIEPASK